MPMLIDRSGSIAERWTLLDDHTPLPEKGRVILPLERLEEGMASGPLLRIGLTLPNDAGVEPLRPRLHRLALIRIVFPSFADGRGFSLARRLRGMGYDGRLRAAGPLIADQFAHLTAVGFDEVEVADAVARRQPAGQWLEAAHRISRYYQHRPGTPAIAEARRVHA